MKWGIGGIGLVVWGMGIRRLSWGRAIRFGILMMSLLRCRMYALSGILDIYRCMCVFFSYILAYATLKYPTGLDDILDLKLNLKSHRILSPNMNLT